MSTEPTTQLPASPPLPSSDLLADLERRMDSAWAEYIAACDKAARDRQAIDATVYRVHGKWVALYCKLKQAKSADTEVSSGAKTT